MRFIHHLSHSPFDQIIAFFTLFSFEFQIWPKCVHNPKMMNISTVKIFEANTKKERDDDKKRVNEMLISKIL